MLNKKKSYFPYRNFFYRILRALNYTNAKHELRYNKNRRYQSIKIWYNGKVMTVEGTDKVFNNEALKCRESTV